MNGFETILPFLKPIEHLILDDSISEVMVNGADSVFIEKCGYLQPVSGVSLGSAATSRNPTRFSTRGFPMAAGSPPSFRRAVFAASL
jgi:hypothetical protein